MTSNLNKYGNWYETEVAQNIIAKKYLHEGESSFADLANRVSSIFSENLQKYIKKAMYDGDFFLAGRSLYGAGAKGKFKATMSNCYILPNVRDDLESIFNTCKEMAVTFSRGGGCGLNISNLRPDGAKVNNAARTSSGAVSFMDMFDQVGEIIGCNHRRAALLLGLRCDHPDLEKFLTIKRNNTKIQAANISVLFTDEFMQAVKDNKDYTLHFDVKASGEHIEKVINARDFFMRFCEQGRDWAEPGGLFIDRINSYSLLDGYPKDEYHIDITNPCVSGDTLILTDNGYKRIDSVVGEPTNIWNGYRWSTVEPKVTGHNQKMLKIEFSNGMSLKCTNYHKFILNDNSRVEAQHLKIGDKLVKWNFPVIQGKEHIEAKKAYTMGFYSGDGSKGRAEITLYGEKELLLKYLDYANYKQQFSNNINNSDRTMVYLKENFDKDFVPDISYDINTRLNWLAGIIDSDGTLNDKEGGISISSVNKAFLLKIKEMLDCLGVESSISLMRANCIRKLPSNDGTGQYKDYQCQDCFRIVISSKNVNTLCKLGLQTHRVKLVSNVGRNNLHFINIKSIEPIEDAETVYCVNEPYNHSVTFNGIVTSNCAEYCGNAYNACSLASINLYNCIDNPFTPYASFNESKFRGLVALGVRALDEVLDYGYDMQPLDANRKCIDDWRAIGLGLFGIADALVALGIRYGSEESVHFIKEVAGFMQISALMTSSQIAKEKGSFGKYDFEKVIKSSLIKNLSNGAVLKAIEKNGLRNGSLLSIAPTGTISTMCGCTGGVEPIYQVSYERTTHALEKQGKTFKVFAKGVDHLLRYNNINPDSITVDEIKKRFPFVVDTYDIKPSDRVEFQAALQSHVDNAISSTINLKEYTTTQEIFDTYMQAWQLGCKGITVFRDNCERISILGKNGTDKAAKDKAKEIKTDSKPDDKPVLIKKLDYLLPSKRNGVKALWGRTYVYHTACVRKFYVTVNTTDDGDIFEVFVGADTGCQANINTITRLTSYALRLGGKVEDIIDELNSAVCPACSHLKRTGDTECNKSCASCIADALKDFYGNLGKGKGGDIVRNELASRMQEVKEPVHNDLAVCPECGQKTLKPEGKCVNCTNCGYSKCD